MNLVEELHAVTRALNEAGIPYAVCGGVAVVIHGAVRSTKDIDLLIPSRDLDRAVKAVTDLGYVFSSLPMTFDAGTARERQVRRVTKVDGNEHLILDFILEESSLRGFLADRVEVNLPEGRLTVVSRDTLLRMKRLAGRKQDLADIEALEQGNAT